MTRKVNKVENKSSDESSVSTDTKVSTEDKTFSKVTETIDTTIVIPGIKLQSESTGQNTQVIMNGDTLKASYDPIKNIINAQFTGTSKSINVQKEKKTEIQANIKKEEVKSSDSSGKKTSESLIISKDVKRNYLPLVLGGIGLIVVIIIVVIIYIKKKKLLL
jgi:hypothetical protein